MAKQGPGLTVQQQRLTRRVSALTVGMSFAALFCSVVVFYWIAVHKTIHRVDRAIVVTIVDSMDLYHALIETHEMAAEAGSGNQITAQGDARQRLQAAGARLDASHERLHLLFDDHRPFPSIVEAPFSFLARILGTTRVSDPVQAVWADTTGGATIHDLISREIEVCNRICPGIDLSPAERRAELEALRDVVVGQLLPRLNALSAANSEWKGFTGIAAKLTVAITFLLVAGAIVLTRSLLVDPLLRQAGQVSERLTLENRELERRVQERTQNLQRALYEAKAAVAARSAFLANMSHEIRTPMNGVLGVAALLERTPLTPQQTTLVSTITQSGSLLLRVINDVLDMASASAGKMQIEDRPTLIREVIMDVLALNEPRAREKGLSLDFDYQKNARYPVMTDPDRIMQVVGNLIGNAIKFTDSGLVMVTLREESRDDQVLVTLSVADTGPGISEADAKRVFEPFEQAGDFGRSEGTGLGLALCQTMVEQMGGRIWLESTLGEGSTFHVDLTLKRARKTDGPVETTRARAIQSGKRSVR